MNRRRVRAVVGGAFPEFLSRLLLPVLALTVGGCAGETGPRSGPNGGTEAPLDLSSATFVGRDACRECHEAETAAWEGSHHDLALDVAVDSTVLGDFQDASFTHLGITHRFFRRGEEFWVETEGPDGGMAEYPVTHVIGVEPLQQYLIPFPGGRLQTLPMTWDTRPREEGGQRWYHIYGDERIDPEDPLFWTTVNQNWNYQCAECHSTDLQKNYRQGTNRYETTWEEIDVSCEACHGPASIHLERTRAAAEAAGPGAAPGAGYTTPPGGDLPVRLSAANPGTWTWDPAQGKPVRSAPTGPTQQVDACARCHARRGLEALRYTHGEASFLDTHRPSLPLDPLYFHDGQILDEVYVYGSFLQSRMHQAGVLCSDCHDPHSNATLAPGAQVCARCHAPQVYAGPQHDFHPRSAGAGAGSESGVGAGSGSAPDPDCLSCHMPQRTYMGVDERGDHSFRIPRPDLTVSIGTPNACGDCHGDRTALWADSALAVWYGPNRRGAEPHYGEALAAAASGGPAWPQGLLGLIRDRELPAIVRAAAVDALSGAHPRHLLEVFPEIADDPDPLVRRTVMEAATPLAPEDRARWAGPGLLDPVRGVRAAAARALVGVDDAVLPEAQRAARPGAEGEWLEGQMTAAELPASQVALGNYYLGTGRAGDAERTFQRALALDSGFTAAWANLADLYRLMGREEEVAALLDEALDAARDPGAVHFARGLLRVRQGRGEEGLEDLEAAQRLEPRSARFAYVYVVALHDLGRPEEAARVLSGALARIPGDPQLLTLAALYAREAGDLAAARAFADQLLEMDPANPDAQALRAQLRAGS